MLKYHPGPTRKYRSIDAEASDDGFLTEQEFLSVFESAITVSCWDFNSALGDTLREKYESLPLIVINVASVVAKNLSKAEYFWLAIPPVFSPVFDRLDDCVEYRPMGGTECKYLGILSGRLKVYECPALPENAMLVGCGDRVMPGTHYGRIRIHNHIV
jgi:hypothetical protein